MRDIQTLGLFDERPQLIKATPKTGDPDGARYYQRECVERVFESFEDFNRAVLIVLATGLGKTQCFSFVAKRWPGRVLVLCHRAELIEQARKRLEQVCRERVEVEQAQLRSSRARIVVGSVQTVYRPERLEELSRKGGFSLIIVDEAHHYVSPTYRKPLEYFKDAKILGVTATPDRSDSLALGQIFDDVAYTMGLKEGIQAGYLVPIKGKEVFIEEVNLDNVSINGGDFAVGELDEAMVKGVEGVVKGMMHHCGQKQGILFFPGVQSARVAAARLNTLREGCAAVIDGETPPELRKRVADDFRAGRLQFLSNCMVATEGFDAPTAAVIGLARPTKSRALYAQMAGRGTRVLPGVVDHIEGAEGAEARRAAIAASAKPYCLLIDFTGKNTKHSLMTPFDLLGGIHDEPVKKKARELQELEENQEKTTEEILEMAAEEVKRIDLARAQIEVKSQVKTRSRDFDPFAALNITNDDKYGLEYGYKAPTERQVATLKERFGFTDEELHGVSRRKASILLNTCYERMRMGLASPKQMKILHRHGVKTSEITSKTASEAIDYIAANKWGKGQDYDPFKLHEIVYGETFE